MKSLDSSDADATVKKLNIFAKFTKMLNLSEKRIHLNISSADSDRFIWGVWVCGGGGTCGGVCGGGVRWVVGVVDDGWTGSWEILSIFGNGISPKWNLQGM